MSSFIIRAFKCSQLIYSIAWSQSTQCWKSPVHSYMHELVMQHPPLILFKTSRWDGKVSKIRSFKKKIASKYFRGTVHGRISHCVYSNHHQWRLVRRRRLGWHPTAAVDGKPPSPWCFPQQRRAIQSHGGRETPVADIRYRATKALASLRKYGLRVIRAAVVTRWQQQISFCLWG